ncbi:hypothetical protein GCM10023085_37850 [Actinomadura viridis]|uniref:Tetratricopeptide repeat protein n=1 Tax=Actinomadura viridis TaxID=58110 RepID=A0A931GHT8_9ACTN|nr:hypothetical protein [Actinomadura viridis]MBG6087680.1 hypothetical protein [Actinomadura viridis]
MSIRPWLPASAGGPLDGSWAEIAFGLGLLYEHEDDLDQAARWFRQAAEDDFPGAALRLGAVLGRLADRRGTGPAEELLAEASRWLSEGLDVTRPGTIGLITDMLDRHQRAAARRGLEPAGTA